MLKSWEKGECWLLTLDVLKFNICIYKIHFLFICWLLTLDVLKFNKLYIIPPNLISWLLTLDVLKYIYIVNIYNKPILLIANIRCIEIILV